MFYFNCRRKNDIHGFAAIGAHTYWHAFATCFLRLYNPVEIEYLEPYFPNEEEKSNAALYAERIRHRYSVHAGKPISDTNFNDMRLCQYWKSRYGGEKIYAGLESHRLKLTYNATYDDLKSMMDRHVLTFGKVMDKKTGSVKVEDFKEITNMDAVAVFSGMAYPVSEGKVKLITAIEGAIKLEKLLGESECYLKSNGE